MKQIAGTLSVTSDAMLVSQGRCVSHLPHAEAASAVRLVRMLSSVCFYIMLCSIFTGTADFVQQFPSVIDSCEPEPSNQAPTCRKDLGEKQKLR